MAVKEIAKSVLQDLLGLGKKIKSTYLTHAGAIPANIQKIMDEQSIKALIRKGTASQEAQSIFKLFPSLKSKIQSTMHEGTTRQLDIAKELAKNLGIVVGAPAAGVLALRSMLKGHNKEAQLKDEKAETFFELGFLTKIAQPPYYPEERGMSPLTGAALGVGTSAALLGHPSSRRFITNIAPESMKRPIEQIGENVYRIFRGEPAQAAKSLASAKAAPEAAVAKPTAQAPAAALAGKTPSAKEMAKELAKELAIASPGKTPSAKDIAQELARGLPAGVGVNLSDRQLDQLSKQLRKIPGDKKKALTGIEQINKAMAASTDPAEIARLAKQRAEIAEATGLAEAKASGAGLMAEQALRTEKANIERQVGAAAEAQKAKRTKDYLTSQLEKYKSQAAKLAPDIAADKIFPIEEATLGLPSYQRSKPGYSKAVSKIEKLKDQARSALPREQFEELFPTSAHAKTRALEEGAVAGRVPGQIAEEPKSMLQTLKDVFFGKKVPKGSSTGVGSDVGQIPGIGRGVAEIPRKLRATRSARGLRQLITREAPTRSIYNLPEAVVKGVARAPIAAVREMAQAAPSAAQAVARAAAPSIAKSKSFWESIKNMLGKIPKFFKRGSLNDEQVELFKLAFYEYLKKFAEDSSEEEGYLDRASRALKEYKEKGMRTLAAPPTQLARAIGIIPEYSPPGEKKFETKQKLRKSRGKREELRKEDIIITPSAKSTQREIERKHFPKKPELEGMRTKLREEGEKAKKELAGKKYKTKLEREMPKGGFKPKEAPLLARLSQKYHAARQAASQAAEGAAAKVVEKTLPSVVAAKEYIRKKVYGEPSASKPATPPTAKPEVAPPSKPAVAPAAKPVAKPTTPLAAKPAVKPSTPAATPKDIISEKAFAQAHKARPATSTPAVAAPAAKPRAQTEKVRQLLEQYISGQRGARKIIEEAKGPMKSKLQTAYAESKREPKTARA